MKNRILLTISVVFLLSHSIFAKATLLNEPDSAYIFSYATTKNLGHNGLHFAWSTDRKNWHSIGPEFRFLFSDYGRWGKEKRMLSPFLFKDIDGLWHCIWSLNETDNTFAHAASTDLISWKPQSYPNLAAAGNCTMPEVFFDKKNKEYVITWLGANGTGSDVFGLTTKDFKTYNPVKPVSGSIRLNSRETFTISGTFETGIVYNVDWKLIENLIKAQQLAQYKQQINNESAKTDSASFAGFKDLNADISIHFDKSKKISDMLVGVFFEDINYAADGGLYAELVQNRDFEYDPSDREFRDTSWNNLKSWSLNGNGATLKIEDESPIHANNSHYVVLKINQAGTGLVNEGFDGIAVKNGEKYDFSLFAKNIDNTSKKLIIRLIGKKGEVYGKTELTINSSKWKKYDAMVVANNTISDSRLEIVPQNPGSIALDMISLFPQKTFKGRKNGLREDLAQTIADIDPRFVRFPGGCVAHGDGLANIYRWKNTIGPLESRKPQRNIWGYHQSAGLGYFEYFQFCEDIGAQPLPVIAAGVPCQNSATGGAGQQGGIPMCDMETYTKDILDLIEWANGDINTEWGKKRAEAGHPKPFNLKYIGIGNEDLITDIFEERYSMIINALKTKHPEITIIGTVGPFFEGSDYVEGWKIASQLSLPLVDEHYYQTPGWFINNQDFYDKYDRARSKVYLGEYASWGNTLYNALSEALYLTAIERNGDVVSMTSYAPMLAKENHTQWHTDLIYFNNTEIKPSVNYYIQKLYGQNSGDNYIESSIKLSDNGADANRRVAVSVVRDSKTNDLVVKMVNMLPVMVKSQIKFDGIKIADKQAIKTILTGKPSDKTIKPETSNMVVNDNFSYETPAYSFTIIRLKTN